METKKNKNQDVYRFSRLFFHIGLFVSTLLVLLAFEYKSVLQTELKYFDGANHLIDDFLIQPIEFSTPPPKPQKPIAVKQVPDDIVVDPDIPIIDQIEILDINTSFVPDVVPIIEKADEIIDFAEVSPMPVGGMEAWHRYLQKNLKYPNQAKKAGIEGTVYVVFVINKDGSIQDIEILRGIGGGCDEETLRVINAAPNWTPGRQRGQTVRVRMRLPVRFKLQ
ncbi:energy transducer TonB [Pararhodonellum marinum]|uniref:energy transducer TonB n=1 Tax=Pararhodonellum marinum TaxID=2755358 RepID=UPI0018904224|nr:energy transducer TonB [Pararhodonellum marinum]